MICPLVTLSRDGILSMRYLLFIFFLSVGLPANAATCKLIDALSYKDNYGFDYKYKFEDVLVDVRGTLFRGDFTINRISFTEETMSWCYELRGEWRCGSVPDISSSMMLKGAKLEKHSSAKLYKDLDGDTIISYSYAYVDNSRAPTNQVTFLNDVFYFRGKYDCR